MKASMAHKFQEANPPPIAVNVVDRNDVGLESQVAPSLQHE